MGSASPQKILKFACAKETYSKVPSEEGPQPCPEPNLKGRSRVSGKTERNFKKRRACLYLKDARAVKVEKGKVLHYV